MRKPLIDIVRSEVNAYQSFVLNNSEEIYRQMEEPESFDVSKWWAEHHNRFPKLALIVKNLLCIPATSANCERAFSTLTDVVTKKRNRLTGETTHKLTFCKHNLTLIPDYTTNIKQTTSQKDQKDEDENISDIDEW